MPDRRHPGGAGARGAAGLRGLLLALALAGPAAAAPPDQASLDLSARLEALAARAAAPDAAAVGAEALIAGSGVMEAAGLPPAPVIPSFAAPEPEAAPAPVARRLDVRLALTMLSQSQGEGENGAVLGAQTEPGLDALVLAGGRAGLADLLRLGREQGLPFEAEGAAVLARVPVVVWAGAELRLGPGEELRLSRADGAFLLNFGALRMRGAAVSAVGGPNATIRSFVPFVTTGEGGTLDVSGARFTGLGFGGTAKFSGFSVMRGLLARPAAPSRIEGSSFADLRGISVSADDGVLFRGNLVRDARGPGLVVARTADARILQNLFAGAGPTNAIRLGHGSGATVAGNVILGGARVGIQVRGGGPGTSVAGNVVWARDGGGIVLADTPCGRVAGNLVIANAQKGIEVRGAGGVVEGNRVWSNNSVAIWVSDQAPDAVTVLRANGVAWNGAGLAAARGGRLVLEANDFSGQFLRLLDGDLAPQTRHLAGDLEGAALTLSAAGAGAVPDGPEPCAAP